MTNYNRFKYIYGHVIAPYQRAWSQQVCGRQFQEPLQVPTGPCRSNNSISRQNYTMGSTIVAFFLHLFTLGFWNINWLADIPAPVYYVRQFGHFWGARKYDSLHRQCVRLPKQTTHKNHGDSIQPSVGPMDINFGLFQDEALKQLGKSCIWMFIWWMLPVETIIGCNLS